MSRMTWFPLSPETSVQMKERGASASISLLPQPVMESILPSDVLSVGSESVKVLWFNLLCLSLSSYSYLWIDLFIHHYILSSFLNCHSRLALFLHSFRLTLPFFLSLLVSSFLFLSLCLSLSFSRLCSAAALRAEGLWLGRKRTGCKTETNSELGHHCFCVRARSADEKLEDKRSNDARYSTGSPRRFWDTENTHAEQELELQPRIYVIRAE